MEQIFIRVKKDDGSFYDKDITDSNYKERWDYYNTIGKGQIMSMLEKVIKGR